MEEGKTSAFFFTLHASHRRIRRCALCSGVYVIQGKDVCVTLKYKSYDGVLPWRGESRNIITAVIPTDAQAAMAVAADPSLIEPEPVDAEPMD